MTQKKSIKNNRTFKIFFLYIFIWNWIYDVNSLQFQPSNDNEMQSNISHLRRRRSIPSTSEAKIVLDKHNEFRSIIGSEGEEPIPSNMRRLTWDEGLAYTALTYAKNCIWKHSDHGLRRTPTLNFVNGENLWAGTGNRARNFDPVHGITIWFNEYKDYDFNNKTCTPGKKCGHYTQVVWATTYKLGCAWTFCPQLKMVADDITVKNAMYMVCHYAPGGNKEGVSLYKVGPRCSACNSFDTCPDNALCHNEARDKFIPYSSNSATLAAALAGTVLILATIGAIAYYIYFNHHSKVVLIMAGMRKSRRVSSAVGLNESQNTKSSVTTEDDDLPSIKESSELKTAKSRGARLSSIRIETIGGPD